MYTLMHYYLKPYLVCSTTMTAATKIMNQKWYIQQVLFFLFFQSCIVGLKFFNAVSGTLMSGGAGSTAFSQLDIESTRITHRGSTKSLLLRMAISDKKSSTAKSKVDKKSSATSAVVKQRKVGAQETNESTNPMKLNSKGLSKQKAVKTAVMSTEKADLKKSTEEAPKISTDSDEIGEKRRTKNKEISNKSVLKMSSEDRNLIVSDILSMIMQEVGEGERRQLFDRDLDIYDEKGRGEDASSTDADNRHSKLLNGVVRIYCTHSLPNFGAINY